jgi:hypothetical protein
MLKLNKFKTYNYLTTIKFSIEKGNNKKINIV